MKTEYWKKSNGDCGTVDEGGHVPDSVKITKLEYDAYVASLPVVPVIDHKDKFSKLLSADEKIDYIAKQLKLA